MRTAVLCLLSVMFLGHCLASDEGKPPQLTSGEGFRGGHANFIVKIESGNRIVGKKYGRGICLDSPCVHILTNYHVAGLIRPSSVEGVGIKSAVYATGPDDDGAVPMRVMNDIHRYNPERDLALLTLKRPLPRKFGAARIASSIPKVGMNVVRYPVTSGKFSGKLIHVGAVQYLDAEMTQHEMDSVLVSDFDSPLGTSGGALCDSEGNLIGLMELHNYSIALSLWSIASFLAHADPALSKEWALPETEETSEALERAVVIGGTGDNPEKAVKTLIEYAKQMNLGMTRVVADSEVRQSGLGVHADPALYEVSLYEAGTRFRQVFSNNRRGPEMDDIPLPVHGIVPGADWEYLLRGLAAASLTYAGETLYDDDIAHVFNFTGMVCPFREKRSGGTWKGDVLCSGEVLTDGSYHPVSIKADFHFDAQSIVSRLRISVRFRLTPLRNGIFEYLPSEVALKAKFKGSPFTYGATNTLTRYRSFGAEHTIVADVAAPVR